MENFWLCDNMREINDIKEKNGMKFIEELEETVLRLHVNGRRLESENKNFKKIINKIEKQGYSILTPKDKIEMSIYKDYKYYEGKEMAYIYCLEQFGYKDVPNLISRLRGWKKVIRNGEVIQIIQTK